MIREVRINEKRLLDLPLRCRNMDDNSESQELSEYVCLVKWIKTVPRDEAKWRSFPKLYTTTMFVLLWTDNRIRSGSSRNNLT